MSLDTDLVGSPGPTRRRRWTSADALLYAVGVGAGQAGDPADLPYVTENSAGVEQKVLPTYGVLVGQGGLGRPMGSFDPAMLVHAEQSFELHAPLPVEGDVEVTSTVTSMVDKGSGALITVESSSRTADGGVPMVTTRSSMFVRGETVAGRGIAPPTAEALPTTSPDAVVTYPTRPEQALLYRLSGDRNPLHSDPSFAARAGFDRPILHGLCTYGITGRALIRTACESDGDRLTSMSGRFTRPVRPGQCLTVEVWNMPGGIRFRTSLDDGTVVLDRGSAVVA
ncbi:MaoC/PaaZ C-terminal domain-containing protein [Rhodococcoides kroppenstedtii]|uniref:MaoC/PaaZ C-terminal domain-containing protein n=1 Tax=Rhodococcoides kroppenstedtii TaxID=293050 RepID=UPI001BDF70FA|nr:MaoC/PaaZ C-terminal domain-containing protein [Rhodococcus kroppenstedtii]MBT1191278.1 MaoC family dehydratase N-terminal domain-containing protein [Rhodococcus kroppenstedtii]